jgi:hypothetical protein
MEDSANSTASNITAPDSEITALCDCFPTIDLVSQVLSEQDKLVLEISLREYISTASIISYGEEKYTPLHIFIEVLNHFVVERNLPKVPIFSHNVDEILRRVTDGRVYINFEIGEEEWPVGSEIIGRSVFVRNVCVNAVTNTDDIEDSEPESETDDSATSSNGETGTLSGTDESGSYDSESE